MDQSLHRLQFTINESGNSHEPSQNNESGSEVRLAAMFANWTNEVLWLQAQHSHQRRWTNMADDEDSVRVEERVKIKIGEFQSARRLNIRFEVAPNIFAPCPVEIFATQSFRDWKTHRSTQQVSFEWAWASSWAPWALILPWSWYLTQP